MPRPPALETAEAREAVEVWAIPAKRIGWRIERRAVRGVVRVAAGAMAITGVARVKERGERMGP